LRLRTVLSALFLFSLQRSPAKYMISQQQNKSTGGEV